MALQHFLIVYDLVGRDRLELREFGHDVHRATKAYAALEEEYRNQDDHGRYEIVLVGADSLDTLRVTHSRYFESEPVRVPF